MAQSVKCLPDTYETLSSALQHLCKTLGMVAFVYNLSMGEIERHDDPLGLLVNQHSQIHMLQVQWKTLSQKKKKDG